MHRIAAVIAGLSLAFVGTSATIAGTINVPGDYTLIQDAIDNSSNGDVINIAAGTYNEYNLNPGGKAITIQGTLNGDGTLATTIDAQQGGIVFVISSGEGSGTVIKDLVITGGSAFIGGGIFLQDSNPTISSCVIQDNESGNRGGGIYCSNGSPTITSSTISDNTAAAIGGGVFCSNGNPTISGCTILGNSANLDGGGIYCSNSEPTISGSVICGNAPDQLNGIGLPAGSLVSDSCDIVSNTFGACCLGGTCMIGTEADCTAAGGTYAGDDVTCGDAGCATPPVTGVCCVSSGCVTNTSDDCTALGGNWLGEDSSCDDCPASCSGDTNNDGVIDIEDLLNMLSSFGSVCP